MSNQEKKPIPMAPSPGVVPGNLLSNVSPPSILPNFVTATTPLEVPVALPKLAEKSMGATAEASNPAAPTLSAQSPLVPDQFSPAIPPSKGEPTLSIRSPEDSQATPQSPASSIPTSSLDTEAFGDPVPGSGLLSWVRGAVASGGLLQRVAERARSSVDTVMTTLDPQMKDYLGGGGMDIHVVVASDKESKIAPVREAFQAVFGKATVVGYAAPSDTAASQPVGFAAGYAAARARLARVRASQPQQPHLTNHVPLVAAEGYLHELGPDRWFEQSVVVLSLESLGVELAVVTQGTPVPGCVLATLRALDHTGGGGGGAQATCGAVMAASLQCGHEAWHEAATGVSRREMLTLAARALAGSYKRVLLASSQEAT